jgi:hypothetical protein
MISRPHPRLARPDPASARRRSDRRGGLKRPAEATHQGGKWQGPRMYEMQGPCPFAGRRPAGCPAGWRSSTGCWYRAPAQSSGFPVLPAFPGLPPGVVPVSGSDVFLLPPRGSAQGAAASIFKIVSVVYNVSTATAVLSPGPGTFPPGHPQFPHRQPARRPSRGTARSASGRNEAGRTNQAGGRNQAAGRNQAGRTAGAAARRSSG